MTSYAHFRIVLALSPFTSEMSSSSNYSSSSSESEAEENFNEDSVECCGVVPYDEDLEPIATEEEAAEQEARMAQEVEVEREYRARLTRQVDVTAWYDKTFRYKNGHLFILP